MLLRCSSQAGFFLSLPFLTLRFCSSSRGLCRGVGFRPFPQPEMSRMSRMRGSAMVAATTAVAAAGASLAYVFFAKPSESSPPSRPSRPPLSAPTRHFTPPPELPSSSKLLIPNINLNFDDGEPEPEPNVSSQCDYGPLWECIVNGNGGCEVLEEELRNCLARATKPEPAVTSECDYAPLWECIVNGNGGCEVLEEDLRHCLERSRKSRRP